MSVKIVMNNNTKFNVDGTLEAWIQKVRSQQIIEISSKTYVISQNISELYEKTEKALKSSK